MKLLSHYIENQAKLYPEIVNWQNHYITEALAYSYRDTQYDRGTFPSTIHWHDYYELVIFEDGDIQYSCEGNVYCPRQGDIILIPPGKFHMSSICREQTSYKRHVFYLYPDAFSSLGHDALVSFLSRAEKGELFAFSSIDLKSELQDQLTLLKRALSDRPTALDKALALSYIIRIFYLFNSKELLPGVDAAYYPDGILELRNYIDTSYADIESVTQIADKFFYSREYVSRLFKKYFDVTISEYILKRRIAESQPQILKHCPLIDVAHNVGFGSLSTFIRAFRKVTGMTPSEYRRLSKHSVGTYTEDNASDK